MANRGGNSNFRGRRAVDLLSRTFHGTVDDMLAILFDEKWEAADAFREGLRQALNRRAGFVAKQSEEFRRFADRLARFDGYAEKSSVAALSYLYWRRALSENSAENAELVRVTLRDSVPDAAHDSSLIAAIPRAMQLLIQDVGSTERSFGDVLRVERGRDSLPHGGFVGNMRGMGLGQADSSGSHWVRSGQ